MKQHLLTLVLLCHSVGSLFAKDLPYPEARVNFQDYKTLVTEVEKYREERLIDLNTFIEMSKQEGVIILDTRSAFRFDRIHVKGATHLNFSDFTQNNLAQLIPSPETIILIYCNNNFQGNQTDFATKSFVPIAPRSLIDTAENPLAESRIENTPTTQFAQQEKPRMMALNIPTFLNLYGYGYRNVYELNELVNVGDPRITFEGSVVKSEKE